MRWVDETMRAVVELAAPDAEGQPRAPIHLIFYNDFEQRLLLEGLARHFTSVLGATPLYDFVTQLAAFDSPVVTFLDARDPRAEELPHGLPVAAGRGRLPAGSTGTSPQPYREIFRARLFDFWGKLDRTTPAGESRRGTPAAPASTARSRWSTPTPPGASWPPPRPAASATTFAALPRAPPPTLLRGLPRPPAGGDGAHRPRLQGQQADREDAPSTCPTCAASRAGRARWPQALDEFVTDRAARRAGRLEGRAAGAAGAAGPGRRDAAGRATTPADQEPGVADAQRARTGAGSAQGAVRAAVPRGAPRRGPRARCRRSSGRRPSGRRRALPSGCAWTSRAWTARLDEALALYHAARGRPRGPLPAH